MANGNINNTHFTGYFSRNSQIQNTNELNLHCPVVSEMSKFDKNSDNKNPCFFCSQI